MKVNKKHIVYIVGQMATWNYSRIRMFEVLDKDKVVGYVGWQSSLFIIHVIFIIVKNIHTYIYKPKLI